MKSTIVEHYFFGQGLTLLDDYTILEVRSLSSEKLLSEDSNDFRSMRPQILESDMIEIQDTALAMAIQDQGMVYKEWLISKDELMEFGKQKLFEIDLNRLVNNQLRN